METMHAAGRRNLPPVPRPTADAPAPAADPVEATPVDEAPVDEAPVDEAPVDEAPVDETPVDETPVDEAPVEESPVDRTLELRRRATEQRAGEEFADDDTASFERAIDLPAELGLDPALLAVADDPELALDDDDPAQEFVSRLRAAAGGFAEAAGAEHAVVREAVPPARHRRSRCRVVLRYADGDEVDLTFLGAVGRPGSPAWQDFDQQIQRWLGTGQERQSAWLVEDSESADGIAVDVPAWLAAA